jgi:signal transduction histidine kinase/DNA-binding response OmpR family regulator
VRLKPLPGPGAAAAAAAPLERTDILIVDDLPEKLLVFSTVLEDLGQNLVFARSGAEALREVLAHEFAVILLDVNMPDIDGFETAGLIRSYKKSAHTPIIFITAYADEIQTARGYSLGAVDYILSPLVPEVLRSKVKVFVDLHVMQRRVRRQADEKVALAAAVAAQHVAENNDRRSRFLSNASRQLSASLDLGVGMRRLVELLVPELAALAVVGLFDEDGQLQRCLVGCARLPPQDAVLGDVLGEVGCGQLPAPLRDALARAVQTRQRVDLDEAGLLPLVAAMPGLGFPGQVLPGAAVVVPLLAGDRAPGALLVAAARREAGAAAAQPPLRPPPDWAALEELASRAAIAFENARLYQSLQAEIAERRAAEAELKRMNQRKDEFLAMLSHELRNPLAPIRNAVEMIRRIAPPDQKLAWATDVMDRQTHHLTRLVDELLDVARINQGVIALQRDAVDLNAVLAHSIDIARATIESRSHVLVVEQPPTPVWMNGDFARLSQVVANLLHNAAKYSENGGRIVLTLAVRDGDAVVTVRDNGIGIDAALMPRIFDLFAQGERSLDRSQGGLGVGLTLVRRLVELHGGTVTASSAGAGRGAEFEVRLPCLRVVGEAAAAPPPETAGASGSRVLVVDDNQDAAETIALYLQLEGHEVKTVRDGHQALACVGVFAPQVVVLDIGLPGLNGYEVAQRLRELPATRQALIVALSGYGQPEDKQRALEAHFDHYFVKPADPQALVDRIAAWQHSGTVAGPGDEAARTPGRRA